MENKPLIYPYTYCHRTFTLVFHPGDPNEGSNRVHKISYYLLKDIKDVYLGEVQFTTWSDMREIYEGVIGAIHQWTHSTVRIEKELEQLGFRRM